MMILGKSINLTNDMFNATDVPTDYDVRVESIYRFCFVIK